MRKFGETFDNRYFFCYILLWIFITVEDFIDIDLAFIKDAIETAKTTVQCAILSVSCICELHRFCTCILSMGL